MKAHEKPRTMTEMDPRVSFTTFPSEVTAHYKTISNNVISILVSSTKSAAQCARVHNKMLKRSLFFLDDSTNQF